MFAATLGLLSTWSHVVSGVHPEAWLGRLTTEGKVQNFGPLRNDDRLDAALVYPALTADQIMSFDFGNLLGPEENLSIGPVKTKVPGNLFLPRQQESYGIIPLTIEKNPWRLNLNVDDEQQLASVAVSVRFNKAADLGRAKAPYWEILPLIEVKQIAASHVSRWAGERDILLTLTRSFVSGQTVSWTREKAGKRELDFAVSLSKSNEQRFLLSDLQWQMGRLFTPRYLANSPALGLTLFGRIENHPTENKPNRIRLFVAHEGQPRTADGLPIQLRGVKLLGDQLTWDVPRGFGRMALLRGNPLTPTIYSDETIAGLLGYSLDSAFNVLRHATAPLHEWLDPNQGQWRIVPPPKKDERIIVVYASALGPDPLITDIDTIEAEVVQ